MKFAEDFLLSVLLSWVLFLQIVTIFLVPSSPSPPHRRSVLSLLLSWELPFVTCSYH